MVGSFSRLAHSTPIFARPNFCHTCGRASLARMRGLGLRLCRLTRESCCPRRTCTSPCAGASQCPSRTGIAEAMGSRGAAACSMSWATMRQRADCWPAAPPCLHKHGTPAGRRTREVFFFFPPDNFPSSRGETAGWRKANTWVRVAREGLGPEGRVAPSAANTSGPGVSAQDRRRLDLVVYGATRLGEALCCDATLVAPLRRDGRPQPHAAEEDGAAIAVARRRKEARYPELRRPGTQRLVVFACETGGRWGPEASLPLDGKRRANKKRCIEKTSRR